MQIITQYQILDYLTPLTYDSGTKSFLNKIKLTSYLVFTLDANFIIGVTWGLWFFSNFMLIEILVKQVRVKRLKDEKIQRFEDLKIQRFKD